MEKAKDAREKEYKEYVKSHSIEKFKVRIEECKQGNISNESNGYGAWLSANTAIKHGGATWDELGSSAEEVEPFLVQDLTEWVEEARQGKSDLLSVGLLIVNFGEDINILEKIGTTEEELYEFEKNFLK